MRSTTIAMTAVAALLCAIAYAKDPALLWAGLYGAGRTFLQSLPLLIGAFAVAGLIQVMVSSKDVAARLGHGNGLRGIIIGCAAGAVIPGGPYVSYPIAASLLKAGADIGVVVGFVIAKGLWSITRLPMEIALLGSDITFTRYLITLVFPPLAGLLAQGLFGSLGRRLGEDLMKGEQ